MTAKIDPKPLENHLQRISTRFISIDKEVKSAFRQHYDNVLNHMMSCMKQKDHVFEKLYQEVKLAGSYADEIKVTAPNEFDALVILKFLGPNPVSSDPGFVTINITDSITKWLTWVEGTKEKYRRLVDAEGYVIQDGVLDWLRELVKEVLKEQKGILHINGTEYNVSQTNNGPAVTLNVDVQKSTHCKEPGSFSIDFVPALQFQVKSKWIADRQDVSKINSYRFWNAIPKPNRLRSHKNRDWICSYAEIERDLLNRRNRLKPLIRVFKKIRDKANLTNLKSYYIKTIFLHQCEQKSEAYWDGSLAEAFIEMFAVILEHLRTKTLWSLWHNNYNLFSQLNDNQMESIYGNLNKIKDTIEKNLMSGQPDLISKQILTPDEIRAMEESERSDKVKVKEEAAPEGAAKAAKCTIL